MDSLSSLLLRIVLSIPALPFYIGIGVYQWFEEIFLQSWPDFDPPDF